MIDDIDLLEHPTESEAMVVETEFTVGFGNQCNTYVDVIQQALDLALGNTGNLAPDSAVVDALDELYIAARNAGASPLLQLVVPLNQVLRSAEKAGFTLSQADTLLVQEAIIAITLGIDSIVNQKPVPALLSDVTQRVVDVAAENKHEIRANSEATGLVNIFVSDADELLQRLFEQIQRWRASAFVGRGFEEVNRLLVSLQNSADSAGLSSISTVVCLLVERMRAQRVAEAVPDGAFFDLAIETIETLGEDLDRIRNNEQLIEHTELYEKLAVEGGVDAATLKQRLLSEDTASKSASNTAPMRAKGLSEDLYQNLYQNQQPDRGQAAQINAVATEATVNQQSTPKSIADVHIIEHGTENIWPDHRELVDVLREISRGNEAIKQRIEQLRRTIHVYPEARDLTIESDSDHVSSAVSAVDNIFFKIDSLLSKQSKSVTSMASVLGVEEQQTVKALGAELVKHVSAASFRVEYLGGAGSVVIDSQLYEHLLYALRVTLDSVVSPVNLTVEHAVDARASSVQSVLVFDTALDRLMVKIVSQQLQLSEFVVENASLRKVDEQMLKTQLPRFSVDETGLNSNRSSKRQLATDKDTDLIALAALQRLIDIAAFFQGKVTTLLHTDSDFSDTPCEIEIVLPVSAVAQELVLVKRGNRLYGVQSLVIDKIESVGHDSQSASPAPESVLVHCRPRNGTPCVVSADSVVGKQTVSVTKNQSLMLGENYSGAFVFSDSSLVLVVNPESLDPDIPLELEG